MSAAGATAATTDEDRRSVGLDRTGHIQRGADPIVAALEGRAVLGEHRANDRERLVDHVVVDAPPCGGGSRLEGVDARTDVGAPRHELAGAFEQ